MLLNISRHCLQKVHTMAANSKVINRFIMLTLLCYPMLLLTVRGGMSALFFLISIASIIYLFRTPICSTSKQWDGYGKAFTIVMLFPMLAVFLSLIYHGTIRAQPFDGPSRFLLAIPIFFALRRSEVRTFSLLQYGFPLGALSALFCTVLTLHEWKDNLFFVNYIRYSDMALMLGFLSLFSVNWITQDRAPIFILKIFGLLAGLFLSIQSGARGGWVAIPVLFFIWWFSKNSKFSWPKFVAVIFSILFAILLAYAFIGTVHSRLDMIHQDMTNFYQGNKDTSLGIRLQVWQAAYHIFTEHPVFGVGPGGFSQLMTSLSHSGELSVAAASEGRGEALNELVGYAVGFGIFGLISILAVYLVPLFIFIRSTRSPVALIRTSAYMGICFVTGFIIFGLSVQIFNLKMIVSFYSLTLVVLLAAATREIPRPDPI